MRTSYKAPIVKKHFIPGLVFLTILLFGDMSVSGQPFTLLKDIKPGGGGTSDFFPLNVNGILYFTGDDGIHGKELWKSDGTAAGTVMVKDINVGTGRGVTGNLFNVNGVVYFSGYDVGHGSELWKSDGTEAGTVLVKDVLPGSDNGVFLYSSEGVAANGIFFFQAGDGVNGRELWKSDGTEAGTVMIVDINPGKYTSGILKGFPYESIPDQFAEMNGTVYFTASDGGNAFDTELWKSDGTVAGTMKVKDVPGTDIRPKDPINLNGTLMFTADWYGHNQLWRSDGTDAGTFVLADIPSPQFDQYYAILNGSLIFSRGLQLWKSDGTSAGTSVLLSGQTYMVTNVNGTVFFFVVNASNKLELWKTNGTTAGTIMVKDLPLPQANYPFMTGKAGNKFVFEFDDGVHGRELWWSDGTSAGTQLMQEFEPGTGGITCFGITEAGGKVYAEIVNSAYGNELWVENVGSNIPLPLTLLEFRGSVQNDNGILQWKTDNELNTKSFAIERSTDGRHFSDVGYVNSANANGIHLYNYTDASIKSLGSSIIYYRLRQVDADNKSTYSRIVALTLDKQKSFVMLYPNPVRNDINLTITLAKKDKINWLLTDNNGRVIRNGLYELSAGSSAVVIDGQSLSAGNYLLSLNGELLKQTIKIVKQ
jgi:ELWxxDGT repeat protein